ncbi:zinc-dependent alcohol dehydrogenase [Effusibacillus lacus]|uniref:Uncharacterized protein n=1 Tax=Effusibacillus lacus TaxID=1348429 RepID=A0A292YKK4_9BACL|nr:alcohol dehydrogenase catalytic domain-containing protein [Effusibacillus lacus]TCS75553.1 L-iditol 2-dehydrogenase [Effusibacillus lacus]GAX89015.1 hypothetical protein EFBL_0629 [Effusibacillus lacus]
MLAVVKTENRQEVAVRPVQLPKLSSGEVLIEVDYCGVCGSDLHAYNHAPGYEFVELPRILGHEVSGVVVQVAEDEDQHLLNQRVVIESIQYCGECSNCRSERTHICERFRVIGLHFDGGMAQFVKCHSRFVQKIPDALSSPIAALVEPLSIAIHAAESIGRVKTGDKVWVQGCGIIGLFVGVVCGLAGAEVTISGLPRDKEARLRHASDFGLKSFIVGESANSNEKVDLLFECSGSPGGIRDGLERLKKGGRTVMVALYEQDIPLPLTKAVRNEWELLTSYGCQPVDYGSSFSILKQLESQLQNIVSIYPVTMAPQAFNDALQQKVLKPVLSLRG